MKSEHIAIICYALSNMYRTHCGEMKKLDWDVLPKESTERFISIVEAQMADPKTPEQMHNAWMEEMISQGWQFGGKEDLQAKTTPHLVPFQALEPEIALKDLLFITTVAACQSIPDADPEMIMEQIPMNKVPIKYIGHRAVYTDNAYGSGITWKKDQTILVNEELATKLLRHPDVYTVGIVDPQDPEPVEEQLEPEEDPDADDENAIQDAKDAVNAMNRKQALIDFAEVNFQGMKLSSKDNLATLKQKVVGFIDQYGLI